MSETEVIPGAQFVHLGRRGRAVTSEMAQRDNRLLRILYRGSVPDGVLLNKLSLTASQRPILDEMLNRLFDWKMIVIHSPNYKGSRLISLDADGKYWAEELVTARQLKGQTPDGE